MKPIATRGESFGLSATFVLSVANPGQMPPPGEGPIIGLAGRSNVGKSSLINRLTEHGGLARTGKRPGATTLPNLYRIHAGGYFLDFPGYGYMNRGQSTKASSQDASTRIVEARPDIRRVLLLVDARREILSLDVDAARWFRLMSIPVSIVVTKTDTLSRNSRSLPLNAWGQWIEEAADDGLSGPYPVSARTGEGLLDLVRHVREVLGVRPTGE
ncbi:MAG: ribosome biogenesis GTP-binding protein YihA/YsxC [Leptospirillia bacterium]